MLHINLQRLLVGVFAILLCGCSHTIKLYSGERSPQELAYVYTHASTLAVRYMDDQHLPINTGRDVLHLAPGSHKFIVGNWFTKTFVNPVALGYHTDWFLYELVIDLQPGFSYVPWSADPLAFGPKEVCFLAEPHDAPGAKFGTSAGEDTRMPSKNAVKVACGKLIDAKKYIEKYGKP